MPAARVPAVDPRGLEQLALELLTVPSVSSEGPTRQVASLARSWLREKGLRVSEIGPHAHPALLAQWGPASDRPTLLLSAHLDVVPAFESEWRTPPFRPELRRGRLTGRGAADMKAGAAAMMAALEAWGRAGTGRGAALLLTTDEETEMKGALAAADDPRLSALEGILVGEATRLRRGIGEKGLLQFRLEAVGASAHAAEPEEGESAIGSLLDSIAAVRRIRGLWSGKGGSLGKRTLNVGRIEGGTKVNVTASRAHADCDLRFPVSDDPARVERMVRGAVKPVKTVRYQRLHLLPPIATDPHLLLPRIVEKTASAMDRLVLPYATDAARFQPGGGSSRRHPLPTAILGPGDPAGIHKADESIEWAEVLRAARIYGSVLAEWQQERALLAELHGKGLLSRLRR